MKKQVVIFLLFGFAIQLVAQEKPPICIDDNISVRAGDFKDVNVLGNDWWMTGHEVKIMHAGQSPGAYVTFFNDRIQYHSNYYFEGTDTVFYTVKDITNGMISNTGYLIATVDNPGKEYLDVNNIRAMINSYGYQFCDLTEYTPWFEVPKGSGRSSLFSMSLWMGGLAGDTSLHVAAENYRQTGEDYFNGPMAAIYASDHLFEWNKLWKINRDELEYHQLNWNQTGYQIPSAILNWPAHGQIAYGQAPQLAPFIDWNGDGKYQPDWGDMPAVRGDQNLFFIYNDDFADHSETDGAKIGVDILGQAYAFDCPNDSVFNNSIFIHYDIVNRSEQPYFQFHVGFFADFDLGNAFDDFVGCDTINQALYVYNGDSFDDPNSIFGSAGYGNHPPALAILLLNKPLFACMFPSANIGPSALAHTSEEVYNNLKGLRIDGSEIVYDDKPTTFMYTGDPVQNTGWTELQAANQPDDRRAVASVSPQTFLPGDTITLDLGFVWARDYVGDNISSLALLQQRITDLRWFYENDSTPCGLKWLGIQNKQPAEPVLKIYPNPANQFVNIETEISEVIKYEVFDMMGRIVINDALNAEKQINVESLPEGIYILTILTNSKSITKKFIKR